MESAAEAILLYQLNYFRCLGRSEKGGARTRDTMERFPTTPGGSFYFINQAPRPGQQTQAKVFLPGPKPWRGIRTRNLLEWEA
jgi:hypothetical protein